MYRLAIIVPAHNEEKRIGKTLESYLLYFKEIVKLKKLSSFKIMVVINACSDNTEAVVKKYACKFLEIISFKRGGKGFAVIEGFKHALNGDYTHIGFVDADMSTTPEEFYRLFYKINNCEGIVASRYLSESKLTPRNTFSRIIASRIYNFFIRAILIIPFRDTQCGAKIFKQGALRKVITKMGMTQWAFDIELLYLLNKEGFKIKELPTTWSNRDYSTINFWNAGPWMVLSIVRLRILHSPFKRMVRIYDKFIRIFKPTK